MADSGFSTVHNQRVRLTVTLLRRHCRDWIERTTRPTPNAFTASERTVDTVSAHAVHERLDASKSRVEKAETLQ